MRMMQEILADGSYTRDCHRHLQEVVNELQREERDRRRALAEHNRWLKLRATGQHPTHSLSGYRHSYF